MSVANTYNNMGIVFQKLGDYEKALFHYQNALDIKLKSLGGAHIIPKERPRSQTWGFGVISEK